MTPPPSSPSPPAAALLARGGLPLLSSSSANPHAPLGRWLLGTSALVAGMVHVGGLTRLTKSGLSMTDWRPLGSRPPISDEEWNVEFERYRQSPEWEQRRSMSLAEFKYIYYWEWGHRMLGRFVGLVFGGGWAYFTWVHRPQLPSSPLPPSTATASSLIAFPKGIASAIPPGYQPRLALLFAMGGAQGLVGWWMVRSGLGEDRRGDRNEIRVSPYRLAAHLGMAAGTYSLLLWTGLGALSYPADRYGTSGASESGSSLLRQYARKLSPAALEHARRTRLGVLSAVGLTGLTIASGAFVAGNDAGRAYNTYPLMDGRWVPWDDMVDPAKSPAWRNAFETTAAVQFEHRVLGTCTALTAAGAAIYGLFGGRGPSVAGGAAAKAPPLPSATPQARRALAALGTAAAAQMSLGIATLVHYVPVPLAACHQLGSLVVLTSGVCAAHALRYAGRGAVATAAAGGGTASGGGGALPRGAAAVVSKTANFKI
ncbi:hypothetical protein ACHAWF_002988 [Thalassiosira exigua]